MNYLAHALLSGDDPRVLIGNMAADCLKGRLPPDLLPAVIHGVQLHLVVVPSMGCHSEMQQCLYKPSVGFSMQKG